MSIPTTSSWAQMRQQARSLETQTESLFHTYSQYANVSNIPPNPTSEETSITTRINNLLATRATLLTSLTRLLDSDPSPSTIKLSNLSRHREILSEHRTEFTRLTSSLSQARARANLLPSIRSEIAAYNAANPEAAEAEYMLDERRRVENSNDMVDGVLAQAYAVNENFGVQREMLAGIQRRINGAAAMVPGLNGLMGKISAKKRRDGIIFGSFLAFCVLVFLYFL